MKKILVPIDGSENAKRALLKAKEIAEAFNSEITILNVMERKGFDTTSSGVIENKQSEEVLTLAAKEFESYTGKVDTLTRIGAPAENILEISEEGAYSLIIMGSRGLGVFYQAMLGSVSHKVINRSSISVLIVK